MADASSIFGQGGLNEHVDAEALCEEIGLDRREIEWRKDFIDFDREDVERLGRFEGLFEEEGETVADLFYENLTQYQETTEVIGRSPKGVEELKRTQEAYLLTLASGSYGMEYFEDRARIGKLHDILDMPMKHYIGQYGVYYNLLVPIVTERIQSQVSSIVREMTSGTATDGGADVETGSEEFDRSSGSVDVETIERRANEAIEDGIEELHSLLKIINLDMQVVADTYIHSYTQELESTLERQRAVATEVSGAMGELSEASDTVANSAAEISGLAGEQSDNMDQVAGEVSNLSATVEEVASSAEGVARRSQEAAEMAEDGRERGEAVLDVMNDVTEASETVQHDVRSLQETVEEIDEIIDVINDIASQTNLLALNANIEAARAGEAGQGFAVVADEIKGLAEQSQEQAGEIETMLEEIRENTTETVTGLDTTRENITSAAEEVAASISMLEEIADAVEETVVGIEEVSEATDEQAASAEEIAAMVDGAREKAERVADEIEDVAASTEEQAASVSQVEQSMDRLVDHSG